MIKKIVDIKRDTLFDDIVHLEWFDMQKPNLCAISKNKVEFIVKVNNNHLHENDILICEDGYSIKVVKLPSQIYVLTFKNYINFAKIAYEIGNRHQPICIEDLQITILEDSSLKDIILLCETLEDVNIEKKEGFFKANAKAHHQH